jgi:hypothetical protein
MQYQTARELKYEQAIMEDDFNRSAGQNKTEKELGMGKVVREDLLIWVEQCR